MLNWGFNFPNGFALVKLLSRIHLKTRFLSKSSRNRIAFNRKFKLITFKQNTRIAFSHQTNGKPFFFIQKRITRHSQSHDWHQLFRIIIVPTAIKDTQNAVEKFIASKQSWCIGLFPMNCVSIMLIMFWLLWMWVSLFSLFVCRARLCFLWTIERLLVRSNWLNFQRIRCNKHWTIHSSPIFPLTEKPGSYSSTYRHAEHIQGTQTYCNFSEFLCFCVCCSNSLLDFNLFIMHIIY